MIETGNFRHNFRLLIPLFAALMALGPVLMLPGGDTVVTVKVVDKYLLTPLDSATVTLFRGGLPLDTAVTNSQGIAQLAVSLTGIAGQDPLLPDNFEISNAYPNPFTSETRVNGYFPAGGNATVTVYNALGEQVISKTEAVGAGRHIIRINDMHHLPDGVYFGVVQYRDETKVIKMVNSGNAAVTGLISGFGGFSDPDGSQVLENLSLSVTRRSYDPLSRIHNISGDTLIVMELLRLNETVLRAVTPNNQPAQGVRFKIDSVDYYTGADGRITRTLLSGSHSMAIHDIRYEDFAVSPLVVRDTLIGAPLSEKIISTYTNPSLYLSDTLRVNPASFVFGTGKDSLYAIASPANFTVQGLTLIPKRSGSLPFTIRARATGGTVRQFDFTASVNPTYALKVQYPDTAAITNLSLTIGGVAYTTDAYGMINLKQSGSLRVIATDPRISGIDTIIFFSSTSVIHRATGKEKITFSSWNPSIREDSSITAPVLALFGTTGTFSIVSLSPQLVINGNSLIPAQNAFGSFPFKVVANAAHGTNAERQYTLTVTEMRDIQGYVIDVQTLAKKQGVVKIGNTLYPTDAQGKFAFQITPTPKIDSLKAWVSSEFVATYRNVRTDADLMNLAIPVVTLDSLVAGSGIPDSLAVTPAEFRAYVQEGNSYVITAPAHGIRSIDFQNATNPVPNPNGPHGYVYWIDNNWGPTNYPSTFTTWTSAEREYVRQIIEQEVIGKIAHASHRPSIYLAQPGEAPPLRTGVTGIQPINGVLLVMHMPGGNGYAFNTRDYDSNGLIDAANITIGEPVFGQYPGTIEEAASIITPNPVLNSSLVGKTKFHEGGSTEYLTPMDIKLLRIEENISRVTDAYNPMNTENLPDGTLVTRLYFPTKVHLNDVLKQQ
ncbi:MAG: T9SS type A sorting domain-containing protein [Ignavibacteriaceae bacterium]|nr:T9SS type A sorting domain-containing protein [Ignavibacteriaceae bacterium]